MRLFRPLLLATSALTLLGGASASAMSLQEAASRAVTTNPQIEAAKENRRAQVYELEQGRGLYFPRLDLSADVGPEWTQTRAIDPDKTLLRYDSQLRLTQLLFDGFSREALIEQRASRLDGASYRVEERVETLSLDASEVYLDVLRFQDLLGIARENVAVHESILAQVRQRVEGGESGVGDLQQTESRLAAARETVVSSEQDLRDARARFMRVVGAEAEGLNQAPSVAGSLPGRLDEAVAYAINNSPTLRARAAEIDEAAAVHREAAARYYPTINLELQHSRNYNVDGANGANNDASALLRLNWNLFNGGIDTARRSELAHRVGEQRAETMNVERAIAEETKISWNALDAARTRVGILREQVSSNTEVVATYRQEFLIGQRDLLDLLDSENELFLARSALVSAQYVTEFAAYRILAVMGALSSTLGIGDPAEAVATARAGAEVVPDYSFGNRSPADANRPAPDQPTMTSSTAPAQPAAPMAARPAPSSGQHLSAPAVPAPVSDPSLAYAPPAPSPQAAAPVIRVSGGDNTTASLNARSLAAARGQQ
ncbi:TolC family outer membrane protein [Roseospira goensis]|uniref:Adhesin transport system outer membrane protein n=1 Tax=Roseospira goensis TaxID=391922 RepID=A0A7W6RXB4_9PROT|nr:TolC family outer membrane protein [Roseospira goensis]MBB4284931.1 adhesin transport system outer membrane protein [Roseospira goensis]